MITKVIHQHYNNRDEDTYYNHHSIILRKVVENGDTTTTFDSKGRKIEQCIGDKWTTYSYTDSTIISKTMLGEGKKIIIEDNVRYRLEFPLVHLAKTVKQYEDYNLVTTERFFSDNSRYSGGEGWAIERHFYYDNDLRRQTDFYDNNNILRGCYLYEYRKGVIVRHEFNAKSEEVSEEEFHKDIFNRVPWIE